MKKLCLILSLFIVSSCATKDKSEPTDRSESIWREDNPDVYQSGQTSSQPRIDYEGLQTYLRLTRSSQVLGFKESGFNTCSVGHGYSKTQDCRNQYFVVIHFRLFCRDSVGTISTALGAADLAPLSQRAIEWNLKDAKGVAYTDSEGYGQIRVVSPIPQRLQRLRLSAGDQFLYVRAGEINRIVTPEPWCSQGVVSTGN